MEASGFFGSLRFFFGWRKMDLDFKADRVRFILADPSIPANIGAAARAIKTMGFRQLWVSNPRVKDYRHDPDAVRLSTQAEDVLSESRETASLAEALEASATPGRSRAITTSSGRRSIRSGPLRRRPPRCSLRPRGIPPRGDIAVCFRH